LSKKRAKERKRVGLQERKRDVIRKNVFMIAKKENELATKMTKLCKERCCKRERK
jgi:hypothetical protein